MSSIVIADDDLEMRRMLGAFFGRVGFDVTLAADGKELRRALEIMAEAGRTPDVVIADIQMPGPTGLHVLAWLRRKLPAVRVILITAFGDPGTHARARKLGAVAVIDKPFDLEDLRGVIQKLLRRCGAEAAP